MPSTSLTVRNGEFVQNRFQIVLTLIAIGVGSFISSGGYAAEVEYYLLDNGTLLIHGTDDRDLFYAFMENVGHSGSPEFDLRISTWDWSADDWRHTRFPLQKVNEIVCHMGEGNDRWIEEFLPYGVPGDLYHLIDVDPDLSVAVFGGKGEDEIACWTNHAYVSGGIDDDILLVHGKGTEVMGGTGNDYIYSNGRGATLFGGPGDDWLRPIGLENVAYGEEGQDFFDYVHPSSRIKTGPGYDVWHVASIESVVDAGPNEGFSRDYWTEYDYRDSFTSLRGFTWNAFYYIKLYDNAGYEIYSDPDFFE